MPGNPITLASTLQCAHGGQIKVTQGDARVLIAGSPVVTVGATGLVSGCPLPQSAPFDQTVTWTAGTSRVLASGKPLALDTTPTPTAATQSPLVVVVNQEKVSAT